MAVVYHNGKPSLYINGVWKKDGLQSLKQHVYLGTQFPGGYYGSQGDGILDEVRIWSVARTQSEIAANKDGELTGPQTGLVGYWPMNEGTGLVLHDVSGSGRDVDLTSAGYTSASWTNGRYSMASIAGSYRYGFNSKEKDQDIDQDDYDYGMRIYDARLGKFLSVDPLTAKYPWLTPYQFASNSPILFIDIDGAEGGNSLVKEMQKVSAQYKNWSLQEVQAYQAALTSNLYGNNKVTTADGTVMLALRTVAEKLNPQVSLFSEEQKQQQFENNSNSTVAILLWEFATGQGPKERKFNLGTHVFADDFAKGTEGSIFSGRKLYSEVVTILKQKIEEALVNSSESYLDYLAQGKSYSFGLPFSPDQTGFLESAEKHFESNLPQFFIGGATALVTPVDGTSIDVTVSNITSRSSLGLHLLDNFTDQSIYYDNRTPISNIKQTIRFRIINISPANLNYSKDPLSGKAINEEQKVKQNGNSA